MGEANSHLPARSKKRDTFYLPIALRSLLALFGGGMGWLGVYTAVPVIATDWYRHSPWGSFLPITVILVLVLLIAFVFCWTALAMRLVVTPDGIEYHEPGLALTAKWSDVAGVGQYDATSWSRYGRGIPRYRDQLLLKTAQVRSFPLWSGLNHWLGRDLVIPIDLFGRNWRVTRLGYLIHSHAPHFREFGRNDAGQRRA